MTKKLLSIILVLAALLLSCGKKADPETESKTQVSTPVISLAEGTYIGTQSATISCSTSAAIIKYTVDGSTPSISNGIVYAGETISIASSLTIKAYAYKTDMADSNIVSVSYIIDSIYAGEPIFNPDAGTYNVVQNITLTSTTSGASIRYTLDNSDPSDTVGTLYTVPIAVSSNVTIKAIAYKAGKINSSVITKSYVIDLGTVAKPTISLTSGTYNNNQTVTISCATSGSSIKYTTDGSDPSPTNGTLYSGSITISQNTTLKAMGYKTSYNNSLIASETYVLIAAIPSISLNTGTYNIDKSVTMATITTGASMKYTIDGSDPSPSNGTLYSGAITISQTTTLKVMSYKTGYDNSGINSRIYTYVITDPTINVASGNYNNDINVTISSSSTGATIRYTTDGSDPSQSNGTIYSGSIIINSGTTLKAIAYKTGCTDSQIISRAYTFSVGAPVFSAVSITSNQVNITSVTSGASIRYTTDGSDPSSTNGILYSGAITTGAQQTFKAIAYKTGWVDSSIITITLKSFWAQNVQTSTNYQIPAELKATGTKSLIYVDLNSYSKVTLSQASAMATEFDNNIYAKITAKFGAEPDVDSNSKVILLILDIKDGYSGSGGYVAGYFSPSNEVTGTYSNVADMLYMDCYPAVVNSADFNGTMAHEFQHMINFNQKYLLGGSVFQDTWINEGLSSAAETVYSGSLVSWKIDYYNQDTTTFIRQGVNFLSWGIYSEVLPNYSTVYLFFQWLRLQSSNGDSIFKEIIANSNTDYRAVEQVANTRLYAGTWKDFFRDWLTANMFNNSTGKFGYKGALTLSPKTFNTYSGYSSGMTWSLYPGEAIYVSMSGSKSMTAVSPMFYAGLNTSLKLVSESSPFTYNILLCYNARGTKPTGSTDYVDTQALPAYITGSYVYQAAVLPSLEGNRNNYPIDVSYHSLGKYTKVKTGSKQSKLQSKESYLNSF